MIEKDIKQLVNDFLYCEADNDLVGMFTSVVNGIIKIKNRYPYISFEVFSMPDNYYKLSPHFPRMELRESLRTLIISFCNSNDEIEVNTQNIFSCLASALLVFHFPSNIAWDLIDRNQLIERDDSKKMLLNDGMAVAWVKTPSGINHSGMLVK